MNTENAPTISEALANKMLRGVSGGGYLGINWRIFDADGEPDLKSRLFPGAWIVTENYYGSVFLRVNEDLTLTEYVIGDY